MNTINWNEMDDILDEKINQIFCGNVPYDDFQKRKMIFQSLVDNTEYDSDLLVGILNLSTKRKRVEEIIDPLRNGKGVCNGISYAYKMLLEKVGIYSMLIFSKLRYDKSDVEYFLEKGANIKTDKEGKYILDHMLVLVGNSDQTYSFDDPTCAILDKNKQDLYYNYDLDRAKENNQYDFLGCPADFLNCLVGRESSSKEKEIEKKNVDFEYLRGFMRLPKEIKKYQERTEIIEENER